MEVVPLPSCKNVFLIYIDGQVYSMLRRPKNCYKKQDGFLLESIQTFHHTKIYLIANNKQKLLITWQQIQRSTNEKTFDVLRLCSVYARQRQSHSLRKIPQDTCIKQRNSSACTIAMATEGFVCLPEESFKPWLATQSTGKH